MSELIETNAVELPAVADDASQPFGDSFASRLMRLEPGQMSQHLADYSERRNTFTQWLLSELEEGVHYGHPPGTEPEWQDRPDGRYFKMGRNWVHQSQWQPKQCLYKAGAQRICELLRLRPSYVACPEMAEMLSDETSRYVAVKCVLHDKDGASVCGEGHGSRGTRNMRGNCDIGNATMKMAEKSALINAILNTLSLSDIFTQDIDTPANQGPDTSGSPPEHNSAAPKRAARDNAVTGKHLKQLSDRWKKHFKVTDGDKEAEFEFRQWCEKATGINKDEVTKVRSWSQSQYRKAIAAIEDLEVPSIDVNEDEVPY